MIELIIFLILSFFLGYAIGKIRGADDILKAWDKYIKDHTVYNTITNSYEIK